MQLVLLILSLVGALIAIVGWFIERTFTFDWLRRRLCPKTDTVLRVLEEFRGNPKLGISRDHPAFPLLSAAWPNFPSTSTVRAIGRTVAYMEFGTEVKNDIGLILLDDKLIRIEGHDWTISKATDALINATQKRLRLLGMTVFFVGVVITVLVAIVRFASAP